MRKIVFPLLFLVAASCSQGTSVLKNAPEQLSGTPVSAVSVMLSWTPSVSSAVTITRIYLQTNYDGAWLPIQDVLVPSTTATISALAPNTQYGFYATALDAAGDESGPSNIVYWITAPILSISRLTGLTFPTAVGALYTILGSADLLTWSEIDSIRAADTTTTVPVDFTQDNKMFYRVRWESP